MAYKKKNPDLPELKRQIKENKLKPLYLFYGTETFLKETYIKAIRDAVPDNGFEEFNHITLKGPDVTLSEYDDAWESFPMMAEKKAALYKRQRDIQVRNRGKKGILEGEAFALSR